MYRETERRVGGRWGRRFQLLLKRTVDLTVSLPAIALLSPVIALTALAVRIKLGGPVLFKQQRPGKFGVPFHVYKFRTMTDARRPDGELLPDEVRLTAFGKLLRKLSLDELPQLFNVVRGDMSLIGPRPLLMEYLPLYSDEQARRHDLRPGITGWAQVNGRNSVSWEEKFRLDVWYVDHQSFWLDLKIAFMTVFKVMKREGIQQEGQATVRKFVGSREAEGA
ncbi:sugar transferase [Paenibacillus spongiae]|uniref:Sugar transferase n=2 Tax=Paenibacillus spongiae TaxID=2909671 RepID=A0ABY5SJU8_9BACL|nr:sugar transferase [Paenibacillus spongiae]